MRIYIIGQAVGLVTLYFFIFFIAGTIKKNNSIVDIGWGLGFVITAWFTLFISRSFFVSNIIITLAVTIWGMRLFIHIMRRNLGKGEDFRYAAWRKEWGKWVIPRAFLQVYMLQGLFMLTVASPFILLNSMESSEFTWITALGAVIWMIGFFFESVGDYQLEQFKKNPANKGTICFSYQACLCLKRALKKGPDIRHTRR